ncbi:MAG: CDP-alcohol phosphatidyltransferase family protein [Phyllobacterium sp.]
MSVYKMKARFQDVLRPMTRWLASCGVTANQVTLFAAAGSIAVGLFLFFMNDLRWFLLVPLWLFLRMALNAIDGMLAREHDQKSVVGAYLNEIGDVVSDVALYAPFALIAPFGPLPIAIIIGLAMLTEFVGVLGAMVGASRRYDGPMGKSDRAVVFGVLGFWIGMGGALPGWLVWLQPLLILLLVVTTVNRMRNGVAEATA